MKINKTYYNQSNYFNKRFRLFTNLNSRFQKYRIKKVFQIYKPQKNECVLDLGCGWGTFCFASAPLCQKVTGIDFAEKSIALCRELLAKSSFKNINFICADVQKTNIRSNSYDVIFCVDLVEHLYPKVFQKALGECKRILKEGGKLVIWAPHRGHFLEILKNNNIILRKDISHVDYKSMNFLLESLKEKRFLIKKRFFAESHIPILNHLERLLLPFLPAMRRRLAILAEKKKD